MEWAAKICVGYQVRKLKSWQGPGQVRCRLAKLLNIFSCFEGRRQLVAKQSIREHFSEKALSN